LSNAIDILGASRCAPDSQYWAKPPRQQDGRKTPNPAQWFAAKRAPPWPRV